MTEWRQLSYTPGRWVAVAAVDQWLLVDLAAEDPVVRRCWKLMSEQAGVDAVLDALLSPGVALAPGFVLVSLGEDERRLVTRYPASALVHTGGEDRETAGVEGTSWTDMLLGEERPDGVTLRGVTSSAASSVELPMGSGVTTAGTVHVTAGSPAPQSLAPQSLASQPLTPQPHASRLAAPHPAPTTSLPEPARAPASHEPPAAPRTPAGPPAPAAPPTPAAVPDADETEIHAGDAPSYDFLFGATIRPENLDDAPPPSSARATPAVDDEPRREPTPPPTGYTATLLPAMTEVPPPTLAPPAGGGGDLIDAVPWLVGKDTEPPAPPVAPPTPAASAPAPALAEPAEISATVNRAQLRAAAEAAATPGIKVLAGYCPSRHLSPPHAARCRVCSASMPHQEPFEITRPPLGVLRLATGEVITLDRGVVLGRSPEIPNTEAADRPHVVRVSSPENDVSRTHAEIFLDGWNVYVRDFGSVNGTVVNLPGQPPQRLRDNDPHLVENGTVITLADEFTLTFEVTA